MSRHKKLVVLPSATVALRILAKMRNEIKNADSFVKLDHLANRAAAMQLAFKDVEAVANEAGDAWADAEIKLHHEWARQEKAKGGRPHHKKPTGLKTSPVGATIKNLNLDKNRLARAKRLAQITVRERASLTTKLKAVGKPVNPTTLLAAKRKDAKETKKYLLSTAAFSAEGPFDVVVIDWPWPMQKIDRDVRPNQDVFDYPTMTLAEMREFWTKEIEPRIKPDCHVYFWTTQKFVWDAKALAEQCELRCVLLMVWHKPGGFQPVDLPQNNCEFVVYARRGSPMFIDTKDFPCCFSAPRREHSRKPAIFYETIARVTGGSRLDVFARERHPGFAQYGNEVDKFDDAAE